MDKHKDELKHLQSGQVSAKSVELVKIFVNKKSGPFPPKIFLNLRSTSCKEVVEIHDSMNASIDEGKETTVTASDKSEDKKDINMCALGGIVDVSYFAPNQHSRGMIPW